MEPYLDGESPPVVNRATKHKHLPTGTLSPVSPPPHSPSASPSSSFFQHTPPHSPASPPNDDEDSQPPPPLPPRRPRAVTKEQSLNPFEDMLREVVIEDNLSHTSREEVEESVTKESPLEDTPPCEVITPLPVRDKAPTEVKETSLNPFDDDMEYVDLNEEVCVNLVEVDGADETPPPLPPRRKKKPVVVQETSFVQAPQHSPPTPQLAQANQPTSTTLQKDTRTTNIPRKLTETLTKKQKEITCLVIGDAQVGKSALITQHLSHTFSETYTPTVFETYTTFSKFGPWNVSLKLWDIAGDEKYAKKRPVCYPKANVFMICFDLSLPDSFYYAKQKWIEELGIHGYANHPIIFVGTKQDISAGRQYAILKNNTSDDVEFKKYTLLECSAKTGEGVPQLFEELIREYIYDAKRKEDVSKSFKKAVYEKKSTLESIF